jgi:voltage-gated potassium channel
MTSAPARQKKPARRSTGGLRKTLERLYHGRSRKAARFRFALMAFDLVTVGFFVVASVVAESPWLFVCDYLIALALVADFAARLWLAPRRLAHLADAAVLADLIVIVTLLAAPFIENWGFLRVLRTLRLLRSYQVLRELRDGFRFFRRNEEVIEGVVNLLVFLFVITALVYVLQHETNPQIASYIDALYFTVTTLTTTGFGDITLQGSVGRLLSVVIMVVGVALFLRLVQAIFRPEKVHFRCPDCGLNRHDPDAVHCKHCGRVLPITTEGE